MNADKTVASEVTDTRNTPVGQLARERNDEVADSLRHVLPEDNTHRVAVAAFTSSI